MARLLKSNPGYPQYRRTQAQLQSSGSCQTLDQQLCHILALSGEYLYRQHQIAALYSTYVGTSAGLEISFCTRYRDDQPPGIRSSLQSPGFFQG